MGLLNWKQEVAGQDRDNRASTTYRKRSFRTPKHTGKPESFLNLKRTLEMITYVEMISHRESQCHSINPEISQTHVSIKSIISFVQES